MSKKEDLRLKYRTVSAVLAVSGAVIAAIARFGSVESAFGFLLIGIAVIFFAAGRQKNVPGLLDVKDPLSISILVFAIIGIIVFPLAAIYAHPNFFLMFGSWLVGFWIFWLFLGYKFSRANQ